MSVKLNLNSIQNQKKEWNNYGIELPKFNIDEMQGKTKMSPKWLHFGAGNIFRGYIAQLCQDLLDKGVEECGIIAADIFDYEIIDKIYRPFDNLALFVGLKKDGNNTKRVIASVAEAIKADVCETSEYFRLKEIARNPSLQLMSFTITEKGYGLWNLKGDFLPVVQEDMENGPDAPRHAMSIVTALLWERFKSGRAPIAVVSMDNCSHNGEKLGNAVMTIAKVWEKQGFVSSGFLEYLQAENQVTFPWSMIDKITPRPDSGIEYSLSQTGVEDMQPVTTDKKTFIAPFVNAEIPQYLVIEDKFPNGRPALEKAGVYFADRETVNRTERMKVTTCLNPLHTSLAVFGCLLGYRKIADEMKDDDLHTMVERLGYEEGIPVVVDPGILSPIDFIKEVIEERLPNPYMPDTPQRIATDTSQKMAIRFGETIKAYELKGKQDELNIIPLVIAGWLRYLIGVDDNFEEMVLSPDPLLVTLKNLIGTVKAGEMVTDYSGVREVLSNPALFGTDLCVNGMNIKIENLFTDMVQKKGAVRKTLHRVLESGI